MHLVGLINSICPKGRFERSQNFNFLLCLGLALILSGCSKLYEPKPTVSPIVDNQIITNTASLSNTFVMDRSAPYIICSQPSPDAGFSQQSEGDISVSLFSFGNGSESGGEEEGSSEIEMAGRTPSVLLARELLYRFCEFYRNNSLQKDDAIALYRTNLDIIKTVSSIEATNTKVRESFSLTTEEEIGGEVQSPISSRTFDNRSVPQNNRNDQNVAPQTNLEIGSSSPLSDPVFDAPSAQKINPASQQNPSQTEATDSVNDVDYTQITDKVPCELIGGVWSGGACSPTP